MTSLSGPSMHQPQIISFTGRPESIFKAALLTRLHQLPARPVSELSSTLFPVEAVKSEDYTLNDVQFAYLRRFGRASYNYSEFEIEQLLRQLDWAARFVGPRRYDLLLEVLDEFLTHGLEFVQSGDSLAAREFLSRGRRVRRELRRVEATTRFQVSSDAGRETLVGRCQFKHEIADLVLAYFMQRYPQQRVVLLLPDCTLIGEQGRMLRQAAIKLGPAETELATLWLQYDRAQRRLE